MAGNAGSLPLYRDARRADARDLARLIEIAGEGIPTYLWAQQARPGQTPLDVGAERALREDANFSYRKAVIAEIAGNGMAGQPVTEGTGARIVGGLLAYVLPQPSAADLAALAQVPPLLRPLVELEYRAPGSYYVNALAVLAPYRGRGIGGGLLDIARQRAQQAACARLSVQVFAENERALRLYLRHGYRVADRRPVVAHDCYPYSTEVLLMTAPA